MAYELTTGYYVPANMAYPQGWNRSHQPMTGYYHFRQPTIWDDGRGFLLILVLFILLIIVGKI